MGNKAKKTSFWWSLLLVGVYLWVQVGISAAFSFVFVLYKTLFSTTTPDFQSILQQLMNDYLLIILLVSAVLALIICLLIYRWRKIKVFKHIKVNTDNKNLLAYAIPAGLAIEFVAMVIYGLSASIFGQSAENYEAMITGLTGTWLSFLVVGFVAPIVEDIIFRGLILNELRRNYSMATAIIIQAALFGIMHLNINQGIYAFVAGLVLGLIAVAANSVWPAVIAHIIMNSSALVLSYVDEKYIEDNMALIVSVSVIILIVLCTYCIKKIRHEANNKYIA